MSNNPETPTVEFGGDYHTSQIYSMGYEFAFMSQSETGGVFKQATPFVFCKDFLHDAIWAFLNKTKAAIYDFKYEYGKNPPLMMDQTVLGFRNTQFKGKRKDFETALPACLEFLHLCENKLGFKETEIFSVDTSDSPCWLILGDPGWQMSPTMISLYTLFVRLGCFHTPGASMEDTLNLAEKGEIKIGKSGYAGNNDCKYVKQGRKGIDLIMKHGLEIWYKDQKKNYPPKVGTSDLHNNYGIVNFTNQKPKERMPHWYRPAIWGKQE